MIKHISELLTSFVCQNDKWKIKLFNNWDKVVGDLKDKVTIIKIENKLLVLGVTHPAWAQELFMLSDVLKNRINSLFEKERIKYIRFKTLKREKYIYKKLKSEEHTSVETFNVEEKSGLTKNRFNKNLSLTKNEYLSLTKIKDQELKDNLKSFCFRCKKDNK